ncbi:MAG: hypothetical protein NZ699_19530 [Roseiflexus sp.]|nr:hypothetical protein [Roseiflexus sp.]MDW8146642.1 hypothetical protein [Roseiflexaceae bacterium]
MMSSEKLEALLERIAVALERLADQSNSRIVVTEASRRRSAVEEITDDFKSSASPPPSPILEPFLNSRGIQIKSRPAEDASDPVIDSLSLYLGERYDALSGLLSKIKRAMQTGMPITESLKGRSQQDVSTVCQFCTRLHEIAFLEQYKYFRSPTYLITAKATTLPRA